MFHYIYESKETFMNLKSILIPTTAQGRVLYHEVLQGLGNKEIPSAPKNEMLKFRRENGFNVIRIVKYSITYIEKIPCNGVQKGT